MKIDLAVNCESSQNSAVPESTFHPGAKMSETDNITDAIQASLTNFTQRLEEISSDSFSEMRKCSFFDPIPSECLARDRQGSEIRTFAVGEHITTEGDTMDSFHVLMYGTATAYFNNKIVGNIRGGECIGEGTFFGNENLKRSATVITDGEVIAVEIRKTAVDKMEGEVKSYMDKALLLALFKKLQAANKKIEELMREKEIHESYQPVPISIPK